MAFINKTEAISKLTTAITTSSDPQLQPTVGIPIKSGNLQNYFQSLLDWVFPPNPTLTDLSGKVLGVGRIPLTPITDYTNLEFMTMMPLGGIIMYPLEGVNINIGIGIGNSKASITPSSTTLDGFLFLDGASIDVTATNNAKYKDLKALFVNNGGMYGNTNSNNLLVLPNMKKRVPLCYDVTSSATPSAGAPLAQNYGKVGNIGGSVLTILSTNQIPAHTHGVNITTTSDGLHTHQQGSESLYNYFGGGTLIGPRGWALGGFAAYSGQRTGSNGAHTHSVVGNTASNTGGGQPHDNRMEYMVLNYAIKY